MALILLLAPVLPLTGPPEPESVSMVFEPASEPPTATMPTATMSTATTPAATRPLTPAAQPPAPPAPAATPRAAPPLPAPTPDRPTLQERTPHEHTSPQRRPRPAFHPWTAREPPGRTTSPAALTTEPKAAYEPGPRPPSLASASLVAPRPVAGAAGNAPPDYPPAARRRAEQGRVVVRAEVDSDGGLPTSVTIAHSSGHTLLDQAAVAAVRRWRFIPGLREGQAVRAIADVPIEFRLTD